MAFDAHLAALMPDSVTVSQMTAVSTDGYLTPVYGTASTYTARVVRRDTLVTSVDGTQEVARYTVWIRSTSTFEPHSKFVFSGTTFGEPLTLEAFPDTDGIHHVKASFG